MSRIRGSTRHVAQTAAEPRPPLPGPLASATGGDPLAGVERVMIDGSNLAYALGRGTGPRVHAAEPMPVGAIVGRIRAAFPPATSVEIVFDGPARGSPIGRLATGMRVSYSGRATADSLIDEGVAAQLATDGPAGTWGILVVTDDRGLRDLVRAKGARVAGTTWLAGRLGRVGAHGDRHERHVGSGRSGGGGAGGGGRGPHGTSPGGRGSTAGAPGSTMDGRGSTPGTRSRPRGVASAPLPRAGTTIGHRRPPRNPDEPRPDER